MATSEEAQATLVAYVLRHSNQSYRELSKIIGVSDTTISRIMLKHGYRRIAPAETIDVSKLEVE